MVEWTDFERATIQDIFSKMDYEVVGPAALARRDILVFAFIIEDYYSCAVCANLSSFSWHTGFFS